MRVLTWWATTPYPAAAGQLDDLAAVLPLGHDDDPDFRAGRAPDEAGDFLGGLAAELAPLAPLALDAAEPVADFDPPSRAAAPPSMTRLTTRSPDSRRPRARRRCARVRELSIDRQLRDGTCLVPVERDAMLSCSSFQNSVSSLRQPGRRGPQPATFLGGCFTL